MKKITARQIITILATLVTITINVLANSLPLNGQNTGEISDRFSIYFVPAGYVFSIWGLIYLGLIAFTIYQALPSQRENQIIKRISPAYWLGSLTNSVWIFLWHFEFFPLTLIVMLILLSSLIYIYLKLRVTKLSLDNAQKWFVNTPFSIYLGWISVATIANFSQVLFYLGWGGWGISPVIWAVILLAIATLLGLLMLWRETDRPYALVLVWAIIGIASSQADTPMVANASWFSVAGLILGLFFIPLLQPRLKREARS
jgi:hypothetical protein